MFGFCFFEFFCSLFLSFSSLHYFRLLRFNQFFLPFFLRSTMVLTITYFVLYSSRSWASQESLISTYVMHVFGCDCWIRCSSYTNAQTESRPFQFFLLCPRFILYDRNNDPKKYKKATINKQHSEQRDKPRHGVIPVKRLRRQPFHDGQTGEPCRKRHR